MQLSRANRQEWAAPPPRRLSAQCLIAGAIVTAAGLVRTGYLATHLDQAITVIPDDAFYYLRLANNFVHLGFWTFDGTAPTSGFHLLHGYLLAILNLAIGQQALNWPLMLVLVGTFASVCLGLATAMLAAVARTALGPNAGWWVLPVMVTPIAVDATTMLMESHLVVLGGAAVCYAATGSHRVRLVNGVGLAAIGLLATVSRLDFILLPCAVWLAFRILAGSHRVQARRADILLLGALAGLALTVVHTLVVSGTLLPTSASAKLRWSLAKPVGLFMIIQVLELALILLIVVSAIQGARRGRSSWILGNPVTLASLLSLLGYATFYATATSGSQRWYLTSMLVPASLLLAAVGQLINERWRERAAGVVAAVLAAGCLGLSMADLGTPLWPWQIGMLHAAEEVGADPSIEHIGAWNAGIMSVVSGKTVTNLDGLVDDRAAAASRAGSLFDYLRQRGIDHLADGESVVTTDEAGAVDPRVARCYVKVRRLSRNGDPDGAAGPVWLFAYQPGCG